jgi:hypothetical protein
LRRDSTHRLPSGSLFPFAKENGMAKLLKFDGTTEIVVPADLASGFSLEELYILIGCEMVEAIYLDDGTVMVIDEEGKLRAGFEERHNTRATRLLELAGGMLGDFITGNALICTMQEFQ